MSLTEFLRSGGGRWGRPVVPTGAPKPPQPVADTLTPLPIPAARTSWHETGSEEDGTGIWLPASLLAPGYLVLLAGRWLTVARVDARPGDPYRDTRGWAVVSFLDGAALSTDYASKVYCRDEAALFQAQIGGAR